MIRQQRLYRLREKCVNVALSQNKTGTGLLYIRPGIDLIRYNDGNAHLHRLRDGNREVFLTRWEQKQFRRSEGRPFPFAVRCPVNIT